METSAARKLGAGHSEQAAKMESNVAQVLDTASRSSRECSGSHGSDCSSSCSAATTYSGGEVNLCDDRPGHDVNCLPLLRCHSSTALRCPGQCFCGGGRQRVTPSTEGMIPRAPTRDTPYQRGKRVLPTRTMHGISVDQKVQKVRDSEGHPASVSTSSLDLGPGRPGWARAWRTHNGKPVAHSHWRCQTCRDESYTCLPDADGQRSTEPVFTDVPSSSVLTGSPPWP